MISDSIRAMLAARLGLALVASCLAAVSFSGCERKERVLDVQTPGTDIEVDRNIDTGEVEVDVEEN